MLRQWHIVHTPWRWLGTCADQRLPAAETQVSRQTWHLLGRKTKSVCAIKWALGLRHIAIKVRAASSCKLLQASKGELWREVFSWRHKLPLESCDLPLESYKLVIWCRLIINVSCPSVTGLMVICCKEFFCVSMSSGNIGRRVSHQAAVVDVDHTNHCLCCLSPHLYHCHLHLNRPTLFYLWLSGCVCIRVWLFPPF